MRITLLSRTIRSVLTAGITFSLLSTAAHADLGASGGFTVGDLVVSTVSGSTLDAASAITLNQFALSANGTVATAAGSLTLPQTASGNNAAISGEYGSASEGLLQQSVNGGYLTMMGYGVNADTFNAYTDVTTSPYGTLALGQTTSLTAADQSGTAYTTVSRVVALIGSDGSVDTSTALTGVFNTNNPRSVATVDGSSFYVSGQGVTGDTTQGVFYTTLGATTATAIDTSTNTRAVEIVNNGASNTLYVSRDYNPPGSQSPTNLPQSNIDSLTTASGALPTSAAGVTQTILTPGVDSSKGNQASINLTVATENGVNNSRVGSFVYLSPEQYFFASVNGGTDNVMYVTDSGQPKNGSVDAAALGEGGLQKWELVGGVWTLEYDLVAGLNLVDNATANSATPTAPGVTGLFGLTGQVVTVDGQQEVQLFATSYGLNEMSQSYLYGITDVLSNTTITQANASGETFSTLYTDTTGATELRGVAFAPTVTSTVDASVPLPASLVMMLTGLGVTGVFARRGKRA
ncbi:MAG: VPLPA-CTERM sorting domain-containing protein [Methylococcales bacterium]|nr:VPLPA-CTERM sorting domain-containing protein [Methylococcales bacterium]